AARASPPAVRRRARRPRLRRPRGARADGRPTQRRRRTADRAGHRAARPQRIVERTAGHAARRPRRALGPARVPAEPPRRPHCPAPQPPRNRLLVVERSDLSDGSIADSIVDATNRGARAVNLSLGDAGGRPPVEAFVSAIDFANAHNVVVVTAAADDAVTDQGQPASLVQPAGTGPDLTQNRGLSITSADFFDGPSGGGVGSEISMAAYGSFDTFGGSSGP